MLIVSFLPWPDNLEQLPQIEYDQQQNTRPKELRIIYNFKGSLKMSFMTDIFVVITNPLITAN